MKQKKNNRKKAKHQNRPGSTRNWLDHLNLWLEKHSAVGMLVDFIVFLAMGATLGVFLLTMIDSQGLIVILIICFPLFMNLFYCLMDCILMSFEYRKKNDPPLQILQLYFCTRMQLRLFCILDLGSKDDV